LGVKVPRGKKREDMVTPRHEWLKGSVVGPVQDFARIVNLIAKVVSTFGLAGVFPD